MKPPEEGHPAILPEDRVEADDKSNSKYVCDLTIVSDHLFFSEIGEGSVERTVMQMLWHVKEANKLIQAKVIKGLPTKIRTLSIISLK